MQLYIYNIHFIYYLYPTIYKILDFQTPVRSSSCHIRERLFASTVY